MILALNVGSASFKFALHADDEALTRNLAWAVTMDRGETRLSVDVGTGRPHVHPAGHRAWNAPVQVQAAVVEARTSRTGANPPPGVRMFVVWPW